MKIKLFLLLVLTAISFAGYAQSNPSEYIDLATKKLAAGDCEGAQRFYNIYKKLTGSTNANIEASIEKCMSNAPKTYDIGDDATDLCGYSGYKIAYLDASGKHGFAICYGGRDEFVHVFDSPSLDEFKVMYQNRHSLGLVGEYRTSTCKNSFWGIYYSFDFDTGKTKIAKGVLKYLKILRF